MLGRAQRGLAVSATFSLYAHARLGEERPKEEAASASQKRTCEADAKKSSAHVKEVHEKDESLVQRQGIDSPTKTDKITSMVRGTVELSKSIAKQNGMVLPEEPDAELCAKVRDDVNTIPAVVGGQLAEKYVPKASLPSLLELLSPMQQHLKTRNVPEKKLEPHLYASLAAELASDVMKRIKDEHAQAAFIDSGAAFKQDIEAFLQKVSLCPKWILEQEVRDHMRGDASALQAATTKHLKNTYSLTAPGTGNIPLGSRKVLTEKECKEAVLKLGKRYAGVNAISNAPPGCVVEVGFMERGGSWVTKSASEPYGSAMEVSEMKPSADQAIVLVHDNSFLDMVRVGNALTQIQHLRLEVKESGKPMFVLMTAESRADGKPSADFEKSIRNKIWGLASLKTKGSPCAPPFFHVIHIDDPSMSELHYLGASGLCTCFGGIVDPANDPAKLTTPEDIDSWIENMYKSDDAAHGQHKIRQESDDMGFGCCVDKSDRSKYDREINNNDHKTFMEKLMGH